MQCLGITVLLVLAVAQPYCNSFVQAGSYYDVNLGSQTDRQVSIPEVSTGTIFTYNLCENVSKICEVLTTSGTTTVVRDYQVKQVNNTRVLPSWL